MQLDTSLTITSVIAFVALISPVLTAIINNRYQIKIKRLELEEQRYNDNIKSQKELFEKYCQSLSQVVIHNVYKTETINEYAICYGKAILYMTNEQVEHAKIINTLIEQRNLPEAYKLMNDHILEIKEQINKLNIVSR